MDIYVTCTEFLPNIEPFLKALKLQINDRMNVEGSVFPNSTFHIIQHKE